MTVQDFSQSIAPQFLKPVVYDGKPFIVKELQPTSDRLNLAEAVGQPKAFAKTVDTMGRLAAWAHLRASGRMGAAIADALMAHAGEKGRVVRGRSDAHDHAWRTRD